MNKTIVAFSGRKNAGKSTCSRWMAENAEAGSEVKKFAFAEPLKELCHSLLGIPKELLYGSEADKNTLTDYLWENLPHWHRLPYWQKAEHQGKARMTVRQVMQQVGTMMRFFDEDVWAKACVREMVADPADVCVVEDMRYPNEAAILKSHGGKLVRLTRNPYPDDPHESETALDDYDGFDAVIENSSVGEEEGCKLLREELVRLGVLA